MSAAATLLDRHLHTADLPSAPSTAVATGRQVLGHRYLGKRWQGSVLRGWLLGLLLATATGQSAAAAETPAPASWDALLRNYFLHSNLRDEVGPGQQSYQQEWAQGVIGELRSGYTDGVLGVGFDVHGFLGLKLDGGRGHTGTGLLPVDGKGRSGNYASAGGALKVRMGTYQLRYGEMMVETPVFDTADKRLQPEYATGWMLEGTPRPDMQLQLGHFTGFKNQAGRSSHDDLEGAGVSTRGSAISLVGARFAVTRTFSAALYAAQLDNRWRQDYLNLRMSDARWTLEANAYRTRDQGSATAGAIDTLAYSLLGSHRIGAQTFTLAYQRVEGRTPFDFVGGDSIYLANSVKYADFNGAGERSWQARYDLDLAVFGHPGLSVMARYVSGRGIDSTHTSPDSAYARSLEAGGRHWERDLDLRYRVQQGAAKDLRVTLSHVSHRGNDAQGGRDLDRLYLIVEYPLRGFI